MAVAALAFFLSFGDLEEGPQRWCAYRTKAEASKAAGDGSELAGSSAEMQWQGGAVTRLVEKSESEDAFVVDTYQLNPIGQVMKLSRRGNYINDKPVTAEFVPDASGRLRQTPESRRAIAKLKIESYWLDWPKYSSLGQMPFVGLISRQNGVIAIRYGCMKAHRQ